MQGDHYQVNKEAFITDAVGELNKLKQLIIDSIKAQLYNIDIDASTIVDLSQPTLLKQQEQNSTITSELTNFIRMHQPEGVDIMIGGEIGHIGDKNSTKEDMDAFMQQYLPKLYGKGLGKMSIQTGTEHGGSIDAQGKVQEMAVDMELIEALGEHARSVYSLSGVVQHGASTLPKSMFSEFPKHHAVEIHLSTGIQNIVYDSLPETLRNTIYTWLTINCDKERKAEWTDEQFYYRTRKKAAAEFKEQMWELSRTDKEPIMAHISSYLEELFLSLGMKNTKETVIKYYS
jgi:fructose/tagatose bisphosphate aldolase